MVISHSPTGWTGISIRASMIEAEAWRITRVTAHLGQSDRSPLGATVVPFDLGGWPVSRRFVPWRTGVGALLVIAMLFLMVGGVQGLTASAQAGATANPPPKIDSTSVAPNEVSSAGGTVTLRAAVAHAGTCTFSSTPKLASLPATIDCKSDSTPTIVPKRVTIPGNSGKERIYYHFFVSATGTTTVKSGEFNLIERASTSGAKPGGPTGVGATPHDGSATVVFSPPSSVGSSPITSYVVTATDETDALNGGESQTSTGPGSTVMTGLTDGDTYTFDVSATNAAGTGPSSASKGVVPMEGLFGPATEPTIPGPSGKFLSVSCTGTGNCTAVGGLLVDSEVNGIWGSVTTLDAPSGASFTSVSCSDADDCTAVGALTTSEDLLVPVYVTESAGVWAPAANVADPSGYAQLRGVSCADSADCTAVGYDSAAHEAAYAVESEGVWGPLTDFPTNSYLNGVSCWEAGGCTAVGVEADVLHGVPVYVSQSDGSWGSPGAIPGPVGYTLGDENSVSCTGPGDCTAVGESISTSASNGGSFTSGASYVVESDGVWSSGVLVISGEADLSTVSCTGAGDCAAAYFGSYMFESDGVWGPVNAVANTDTSGTSFTDLSCTAPTVCTAVGWMYETGIPSTPIYAETS